MVIGKSGHNWKGGGDGGGGGWRLRSAMVKRNCLSFLFSWMMMNFLIKVSSSLLLLTQE